MDMLFFNINDGFLEGEVRGYRSTILKRADYTNLSQCDTLDDVKLHLTSTDYGHFLQNEPSPLATTTIIEKCNEKLVDEFRHLRFQATEPLATFMDYITYQYMIDNVVLLITGTLHQRDTTELLHKCHPLGKFDSMATLCVAQTPRELFNTVIVDTPLAPYFQMCLKSDELDEIPIEIIRNTLYKAYFEDFYKFCLSLGGSTADIMKDILEFEADRRSINITINSFGTELTKDMRRDLYPNFGVLYPEGTTKLGDLGETGEYEQVKDIIQPYMTYKEIFYQVSTNPDKSLEDTFFEYEVKLNRHSFEQQFHYAIFYSYIKLKEQEIRNIEWICECISLGQKQKIHQYVNIFEF
jgi:V-type H+-transporting ATPase subunit d